MAHPSEDSLTKASEALARFDFDHPFRVTDEGMIADDVRGLYAPEVYDEQVEGASWEPVTGYSVWNGYVVGGRWFTAFKWVEVPI